MKPPDPLSLRIDTLGDVPDWGARMLQGLNRFTDQVSQVLAGGVKRVENTASSEKNGVTFTTNATVANTFPIKVAHGLQTNPKHVSADLNTDPFTAITTAWSMTWRPSSGGNIEVYFQGLSASTKYVVSFTFE